MILLVGNTKGGVGKTTIAVQLAIARARAGRRVWLVDGDQQGSSAMAIQMRADSGIEPEIACTLFSDARQLRQQVRLQKEAFDDVILDVGGRDTGALRVALMMADVAVVPFAPMSLDLWAIGIMAEVVKDVNAERDGLTCYAVMNQAEPRTASADNKEAADAVRAIGEFTYLDTPLVKRKAFSAATGAGLGVAEQTVPDPKAVAEVERLVSSLFAREMLVN